MGGSSLLLLILIERAWLFWARKIPFVVILKSWGAGHGVWSFGLLLLGRDWKAFFILGAWRLCEVYLL